ncbi:hypothetical protein BC827DRAFT_863420 [Russula dissimulans]|nr:hypothetical protein BC827DRAFT_863420 [Russula dissimulans]
MARTHVFFLASAVICQCKMTKYKALQKPYEVVIQYRIVSYPSVSPSVQALSCFPDWFLDYLSQFGKGVRWPAQASREGVRPFHLVSSVSLIGKECVFVMNASVSHTVGQSLPLWVSCPPVRKRLSLSSTRPPGLRIVGVRVRIVAPQRQLTPQA